MRRLAILLTSAAMLAAAVTAALAQEPPSVMVDPTKGLPNETKSTPSFRTALRQLPCQGQPAALVRRALRHDPGAWLQRSRRKRRVGFRQPGLRCTTCHFCSNSNMLHGPPGAPGWHLTPAEMVWWQKSSAEICAQIKNQERNGGRTLEEIAAHVRDDELVGWGWSPGSGRESAPGSAEETYEAIDR